MDTNNKPTTAAAVTLEMIEAWKKQNPKGVHELVVDDKKGYVRNPNRNDLKYAMTKLRGGSELEMSEALLEETWLGGDQELLEDDDYFFGAVMLIQELTQVKQGQLKKL